MYSIKYNRVAVVNKKLEKSSNQRMIRRGVAANKGGREKKLYKRYLSIDVSIVLSIVGFILFLIRFLTFHLTLNSIIKFERANWSTGQAYSRGEYAYTRTQ